MIKITGSNYFYTFAAIKWIMKKTVVNIALFASGNGSNVQNIVEYFAEKPQFAPRLILTNKPNAYVIERAKNLGIPYLVFTNRELRETGLVLDALKDNDIDFVVLAGFLLRIPADLIDAFPNKIINIHPALLPKYGGKGMYGDFVHQAVKEAQETETGITIHYVNPFYDEGQIIFQKKVALTSSDTSQTIAEKVHTLEYKYFPEIIEQVIS